MQRTYTVASLRLRAQLLSEVRKVVVERYVLLVDLAAPLPFTRTPGKASKYLRWRERAQIEMLLSQLLQGLST